MIYWMRASFRVSTNTISSPSVTRLASGKTISGNSMFVFYSWRFADKKPSRNECVVQACRNWNNVSVDWVCTKRKRAEARPSGVCARTRRLLGMRSDCEISKWYTVAPRLVGIFQGVLRAKKTSYFSNKWMTSKSSELWCCASWARFHEVGRMTWIHCLPHLASCRQMLSLRVISTSPTQLGIYHAFQRIECVHSLWRCWQNTWKWMDKVCENELLDW